MNSEIKFNSLVKRLKENAIIPTASNHTLGVGAVVINEKNELLIK